MLTPSSLLNGRKIVVFYKSDSDATSELLCAAIPLMPLNAMKKFSPKIRKVFDKYPKDKVYTITGGAKYSYARIINHILDCCKAGKASHLSRYDFVDYGNAVNALNDLEMSYFSKNMHNRMKVMAAGPLISSMIGEVYTEFDDAKGSWVRAMAVKGIADAKFSGRLSTRVAHRYYVGKINKVFDDDVRRALAGLRAASLAEGEGNA